MEFTNDIYFDKQLSQGKQVLIKYSGKLFKEFSSEVSIVYGYDETWENTQEVKMELTEDCFQALITIENYSTFNFCFKNNYNIWDNNNYQDYHASIKSIEEVANEFDLEKAFSELLDSILNENETEEATEVNLENGYGLQSVDEIKELDYETSDEEFQNISNEISQISDTVEDDNNIATYEEEIDDEPIDTSSLEQLLSDYNKKQLEKENIVSAQELDDIMDNILNATVDDAEETENKSESLKEVDKDTQLEEIPEDEVTLPTITGEDNHWLTKISEKTASFFSLLNRAFKKLGVLIKETVKDLLSDSDTD